MSDFFDSYRVLNHEQIPDKSKPPTGQPHATFLEKLERDLKIEIISKDEDERLLVFDLIGVDASVANALRRIMLAEVPTMAIEYVWMKHNTSVIQDEVLAHRIGLIPIKADANQFEERPVTSDKATDLNALVFNLRVECNSAADDKPLTVYSKDLKWCPVGGQEDLFGKDGIGPVHDDIILAKLSGNAVLNLEAHCYKGVGKDHTKFSPVATASYRLLPDIRFGSPVTGETAQELKSMCPMNVFDIEDIGGVATATAARPRNCTMCRECIRKEDWSDGSRVRLHRKSDHFIFSVESTGAMEPEEIVRRAITVLKNKAQFFEKELNTLINRNDAPMSAESIEE